MSYPIVSIIIPVYNADRYLSRCLDSVITQTFKDIEIIAIDDGSTDESINVLESYAIKDGRIKIRRTENRGVYYARKTGLSMACGKYVAFVDSDDYVEPDYIECMYSEIGDADLVSTKYYVGTKSGSEHERGDDFLPGIIKNLKNNDSIMKRLLFDKERHEFRPFSVVLWNKLYLKDLFIRIYDEELDMHIYEDMVLLYRYLARCNDIIISNYAGYHYCYNISSLTKGRQIYWERDIGELYVQLTSIFRGSKYECDISQQLEHWIAMLSCEGLNGRMWNNDDIWIPQFIFDLSDLKGKKIALYGAGRAGQDLFRQMRGLGYKLVIWADRKHMDYSDAPMKICSPDDLCKASYDVIFLGASTEELADKMRMSLVNIGIEEKPILWNKPMRTFG